MDNEAQSSATAEQPPMTQSRDDGAEQSWSGAQAGPAKTAGPSRQKKPIQPPSPNNCIVLKNLDNTMTSMELENVLRDVIGSRKAFVNVSMVDGKHSSASRRMAFVNFPSVAAAEEAFPLLAAMKVNNRKVYAEYRRLRPGERERREAQEKKARKFETANMKRATFEMDISPELDENGNEMDKRASFFAKRDTAKRTDDRARAAEKADRERELEADFRAQLITYRDAPVEEGVPIQDVCFDQDLSSYERRIVHVLCDELDLGHVSRSMEDGSRVLFVTKDPERKAQWEVETADARAAAAEKAAEKAALAEEKKKRLRELQERQKSQDGVGAKTPGEASSKGGPAGSTSSSGGTLLAANDRNANQLTPAPPTKAELEGITWFRPRSAMQAESGEAGDTANGSRGIEKPTYKLYVPPRQPIGPDGTIGFVRRNPAGAAAEADGTCNDGVDAATDVSAVDAVAGGSENTEPEPTDVAVADVLGADSSSTRKPEDPKKRSKVALNPHVPPFVFPSI